MKTYLFQFGRTPQLSQAEGEARYGHFEMISKKCPDFYQTSGEAIENPQAFLDSLGGTIRIAEVIDTVAFPKVTDLLVEELMQIVPEGKLTFGMSHFPADEWKLKTLLIGIKKALRKHDRSVRFANRTFRNLDAGTLHNENLFPPKGAEILAIVNDENKLILAKTLAAQDITALSERDYGKPVRDMKVGMLPPKLALMLINFAAIDKTLPKKIWDPFCGTGTIAVEAVRIGAECACSDVSEKMITATKENLEYFFPEQRFQIFEHDATTALSQKIDAEAIVSEGYLGPMFLREVSDSDLANAKHDIEPIYERFFAQAAKSQTIKTLVICFPFWRTRHRRDAFSEKALAAAQKFWKNALACEGLSSRGSLLFRRDNQFVGREIFVFHKR